MTFAIYHCSSTVEFKIHDMLCTFSMLIHQWCEYYEITKVKLIKQNRRLSIISLPHPSQLKRHVHIFVMYSMVARFYKFSLKSTFCYLIQLLYLIVLTNIKKLLTEVRYPIVPKCVWHKLHTSCTVLM